MENTQCYDMAWRQGRWDGGGMDMGGRCLMGGGRTWSSFCALHKSVRQDEMEEDGRRHVCGACVCLVVVGVCGGHSLSPVCVCGEEEEDLYHDIG